MEANFEALSENSQASQGQINEQVNAQVKPNLKRKKSQVWDFFVVTPNDNSKATCNVCGAILSRGGTKPGNFSVSNLKSHLQAKHLTEFNSLIQLQNANESLEPQLMKIQINYFPPNSIQAQNITRAIGVMIALDMRPFSIVESKGFKNLIAILEPRYKIPTRKTFSLEIIHQLYEEVKNFIISKYNLCNLKLAFTTDLWTSINGDSFLSLTAHFIDTKCQRVNLSLETIPYSRNHTAVEISNHRKEALMNWGINYKDPFYFVHDNASNISLAIEMLGYTSIYCANHTLQLVIKNALDFDEISNILKDLRIVAKHFHQSPKSSRLLRERQKSLGQ